MGPAPGPAPAPSRKPTPLRGLCGCRPDAVPLRRGHRSPGAAVSRDRSKWALGPQPGLHSRQHANPLPRCSLTLSRGRNPRRLGLRRVRGTRSLIRAAPASGLRGTLAAKGDPWLRRHLPPKDMVKARDRELQRHSTPPATPSTAQGRLFRDDTGHTWSVWHSPKNPPSRTPIAAPAGIGTGLSFRELNASVLHPCPSLPSISELVPCPRAPGPAAKRTQMPLFSIPFGWAHLPGGSSVLFTLPLFLPFSYFILQTNLVFTFMLFRQTI